MDMDTVVTVLHNLVKRASKPAK